jgi:hypothetical protein
MTVEELIKELKKYPKGYEVIITDGYKLMFWKGNFVVALFEGKVDIGVGGCDETEEEAK